jgi:hypothetical protein
MMASYDYADSVYNVDYKKIKNESEPSRKKLQEEWAEGIIMPKSAATRYDPIN